MQASRRRGMGSFLIGLLSGMVVIIVIALSVFFWAFNNVKIKEIENSIGNQFIQDEEIREKSIKEFIAWFGGYVADVGNLTLESIDETFAFKLPEIPIINAIKNIPFAEISKKAMGTLMDLTVRELIGEQTEGILSNFNDTKIKDMQNDMLELPLGSVIDINEQSPRFLQSLKDVSISELGTSLDTLTLGDMIDIDVNSPQILRKLEETKINELSDKFNNLSLTDIFEDPKDDSLLSKLLNTQIDGQPVGVNNVQQAMDQVLREMTVADFCKMMGIAPPPANIANQPMVEFFEGISGTQEDISA